MRSSYLFSLLFCIITVNCYAQDEHPVSLNIGDPAPQLSVYVWIKGEPVQQYEKGHVYVVEFWATWCAPCKAAMPHLSAIAREYKDKVTVIGIDHNEMPMKSIEERDKKVKNFVDSMGNRMDYHVAIEDSINTVVDWLKNSGEYNKGIPKTFVVNGEGKLAWIGHPAKLPEVLAKILNNDWDLNKVYDKRIFDKYVKALADSLNYELMNYTGVGYSLDPSNKLDSALLYISEIVSKEPALEFTAPIANHTFPTLLILDQEKAYEFGKKLIVTPTYEDPAYYVIINAVKAYADRITLSPKIYQLAAEAQQLEIDEIPYPETFNIPNRYNNMAKMYSHANDKLKAIAAQEKAIDALKRKKNFSQTELASFEERLQQYKKM